MKAKLFPKMNHSRQDSQRMEKCNTQWNAASRPKSTKVIQSILRHTLSIPNETRWTLIYDSLFQINKRKEKFSELTRSVDLKHCSFAVSDHNYIDAFLFCVQPLLQSLDILQGDKSVFYRMIFSALLSLQQKLRIINSGHIMYFKLNIKIILNSMERRFSNILSSNKIEADNIAIVTFSHPRFKRKWLDYMNISSCDKLSSLFKNVVTSKFITTYSGKDFEIKEVLILFTLF
ncbi:Hypothetical protein CINCED_3A003171 [Cinara cedri]|uniref:Uncharacterized protein n=1 Tax=Cinara cedri TaxID=506608 RepID=A0A5E4MNS9_9HEMI|nr:Hypothetical protein CINCED_3A003171 [Cinara cedri]